MQWLVALAALVPLPVDHWARTPLVPRVRSRPPLLQVSSSDAQLPPPPPAPPPANGAEATIAKAEGLPTDLGPLPPVGETLRGVTAKSVSVVTLKLDVDNPLPVPLVDPSATFVQLFRACTPYIKMHQGSTMVIHVASEVLDQKHLFDPIMEEVAVLALLGVRPVLLVGVKQQVDASLRDRGLDELKPKYHHGIRETSEATMRVVQEVSGFMRARVEGALSRGRARSGPVGGVGVDVVGGNFFYTAQPVGVRDGIDFGYTGEVRSVDTAKINQHLNNGEIVLMTALGYSASGTIFNVKTEQIAASAASALGASKLIYLTPQRLLETTRCAPTPQSPAPDDDEFVECALGSQSSVLQSLRLGEAKALIRHYRASAADQMAESQKAESQKAAGSGKAGEREGAAAEEEAKAAAGGDGAEGGVEGGAEGGAAARGLPPVDIVAEAAASSIAADAAAEASMLDLCKHCVRALELGVTRAHLLPPTPGALIQELYTTDGIGTLISRDVYDGIRLATASDIPSILDLIAPLEAAGVLVPRPPEVLARDVHMGYYYVYTRDNTLLACAQLKRYSSTHAELGCLVVAPGYRRQGCGDAMLGFLERTAIAAGVQQLFALSTHTMQWFMERGFTEVPLQALPERRVAIYNHERGSKIYMKNLMTTREVDAEELFWVASLAKENAKGK
jgi:amino-acid N-acetyltransferase